MWQGSEVAHEKDVSRSRQSMGPDSGLDSDCTRHTSTSNAHSKFMKACAAIGMSEEGWAKLHVQPRKICMAYNAAVSADCILVSVMYGVGCSWPTAFMQIPALVVLVTALYLAALIWRGGPLSASQPWYKSMAVIHSVASGFVLVASFVGPDDLVPFDSRIGNVIGSSCLLFSGLSSAMLGGNDADHPPQPYTSLVQPLKNAAFSTLRFIDNMTDYGFVRLLLYQVSPS